MSNPESALDTLTRTALAANNLLPGHLLYLQSIVLKALNSNSSNADQLKALVAERTELTFRVAELEEELAEAKKPKRRTTRTKKTSNAKPES